MNNRSGTSFFGMVIPVPHAKYGNEDGVAQEMKELNHFAGLPVVDMRGIAVG
jgi:hypothetical protein